jgi:hypothetical protein
MPEAQGASVRFPLHQKKKKKPFTISRSVTRKTVSGRTRARPPKKCAAAFRTGKLTPKAWVDAGMAARDAKTKPKKLFSANCARGLPERVQVAGAQFELAWMQHEAKIITRLRRC